MPISRINEVISLSLPVMASTPGSIRFRKESRSFNMLETYKKSIILVKNWLVGWLVGWLVVLIMVFCWLHGQNHIFSRFNRNDSYYW